MNLRLKQRHIEQGYSQECELKLRGCLVTWSLTWAHSKKSRFLITDDDWMTAALACVHCHDKVEEMSHEKMEAVILTAIVRRPENQSASVQ